MKNLAFLAFPEQAELLISELAGRFGITQKPDARYGDLLYFENLALPEGQFPYWTRTVMLEPFFVKFNSIGEAAAELNPGPGTVARLHFVAPEGGEMDGTESVYDVVEHVRPFRAAVQSHGKGV